MQGAQCDCHGHPESGAGCHVSRVRLPVLASTPLQISRVLWDYTIDINNEYDNGENQLSFGARFVITTRL